MSRSSSRRGGGEASGPGAHAEHTAESIHGRRGGSLRRPLLRSAWGALLLGLGLACGGLPSAPPRGGVEEVQLGHPSDELAALPAVMALPIGATSVRWVQWVDPAQPEAVWLGVWMEARREAIEAAYGPSAPVREPLVLPSLVARAILPQHLLQATTPAGPGVVVPAQAELSGGGVVRGWGQVRIVTTGSGFILIATR
ncbi:MAG TPA: hypothetical protein ENK18_07700 [Deltaproteobacteria bacterium]|nr:hypothetical protein [Deltaproteobacteria bacterium]